MLKRLSITNLAILENIDISFQKGFTVLMGGTGAGKSLLIDSLSLLLGARASNELIRTGENKATIKGYFLCSSVKLSAVLSSLNIPFDGENLIVERTLSKSKGVIRANDVSITLSDLLKIAPFLANISSQFDSVKLLNPDNYLSMVDGYKMDAIAPYLENYQESLSEYKKKQAAYEALLEKKRKLDSERDFYTFQLNELKQASLKEGEQEEIENEISLLRNYDAIYNLIQESSECVHGDVLEQLYNLNKNIKKLSSYQAQYQEESTRLDNSYYELEDIFSSLKKEFSSLDYDPNRLQELEDRSSELSRLERKYRKSIDELLTYQNELESLIGKNSTFEDDLLSSKKEAEDARYVCFQKGRELSSSRKQVAKMIEKQLKKSLKDLLLLDHFEIYFNAIPEKEDSSYLKENGLDEIQFLMETNVGEGLKPMDKIISGGESSRILLAFQTILLQSNQVGTAIFDEIDTGISGSASQAVAKKIYEISLSTQVLAITHAPQVASLSDHAVLIEKKIEEGRTFTKLHELDLEEKIDAVAGLISSGQITQKQRDYAKEMIMQKGL